MKWFKASKAKTTLGYLYLLVFIKGTMAKGNRNRSEEKDLEDNE